MQNFQIAKVFRNGKSLVVALPVNYSRELGIERGDHVVFSVSTAGVMFLRKISELEKLEIKPDIIQIT